MKYIKKFNELRDKHNELKEAKIKIYESMSPPMIEVNEDWSDYLLELTDKYGQVTSPYGDVRDVIYIDGLDLGVDINSDSDYVIAHEHDYIWERGNLVSKDPRFKIGFTI